MIQKGTYLNVIDNSGAKFVCCIAVGGHTGQKIAKQGEIILVSVKSLRQKRRASARVKKGGVYPALILRVRKVHCLNKTSMLGFMTNAVVLLTRQNKLIGTRIFGGIGHSVVYTKYAKILSVSAGSLIG